MKDKILKRNKKIIFLERILIVFFIIYCNAEENNLRTQAYAQFPSRIQKYIYNYNKNESMLNVKKILEKFHKISKFSYIQLDVCIYWLLTI